MNTLEWKHIESFNNYEISNTGIVRNKKTGRIIKQFIRNGYPIAPLCNNGKSYQRAVHVLVAKAFILNDDPIEKTVVNHIDENKSNSNASNLNWCSQYENVKYSHDLHPGDTNIDRMKKTLSSKIVQFDMEGNYVKEYNTPAAAREYYSKELIKCLKGEIESYKGYKWKYKNECDNI